MRTSMSQPRSTEVGRSGDRSSPARTIDSIAMTTRQRGEERWSRNFRSRCAGRRRSGRNRDSCSYSFGSRPECRARGTPPARRGAAAPVDFRCPRLGRSTYTPRRCRWEAWRGSRRCGFPLVVARATPPGPLHEPSSGERESGFSRPHFSRAALVAPPPRSRTDATTLWIVSLARTKAGKQLIALYYSLQGCTNLWHRCRY